MTQPNPEAVDAASRSTSVEDQRETLQKFLAAYNRGASLQAEYRELSQNLPTVLALAKEILLKKDESMRALEQALAVVEHVLSNARDKAGRLSDALMEQHETLDSFLADRDSLTNLLRTGQEELLETLSRVEGNEAGSHSGPADLTTVMNMLRVNEGQLGEQLNKFVGAHRTQVHETVEKRIQEVRDFMQRAAGKGAG